MGKSKSVLQIPALSIRQPWASFIRWGVKTIEVRTWSTSYRGPLLICSTAKPEPRMKEWVPPEAFERGMPNGVMICVVELVNIRPFSRADAKKLGADWEEYENGGYLSWVLKDPIPLKPVPIKGQLGLYKVPFSKLKTDPS